MTVPPLPHRRTHGVGDEIAAHLERLIATGELTGPGSHKPKDFSALFA